MLLLQLSRCVPLLHFGCTLRSPNLGFEDALFARRTSHLFSNPGARAAPLLPRLEPFLERFLLLLAHPVEHPFDFPVQEVPMPVAHGNDTALVHSGTEDTR